MSQPPPPDPKTLKDGRYTLLRKLGQGSQAETYEARATDVTHVRPGSTDLAREWEQYVSRARRGATPDPHGLVAIKCFHVGRAKAWKDVELAEREARTLASLAHPSLPRYVEHFEEAGALYLVMEMVEGESLAELRARHDISSVEEVTRMLSDIGEALRYLHGRAPQVVHRDIKPGNIIRRPDGSYALVDFGAVRDRLKPEGGSTVVGTFGYMAPEQFQGRASPKSDLYGLAATALVMLTGQEPEDLPHVGLGIDVEKAAPRGTPKSLVRALASMLTPDPDRRASSVEEALAAPARQAAPPPSQPPRERKRSRADKRDQRQARREAKRLASEAKRRKRGLARGRRAPLVPLLVGQLGLFVAWIVVWVTVGVAVPLVLSILSLLFGRKLRLAAAACVRGAWRAQGAIGRKSAWLSGHRIEDDPAEPTRVRVEAESDRVRVSAVQGAHAHEHALEQQDEEDEEQGRPRSRRRND